MPFAGLLPRPGGHATLASRGGREHTVVLALRHFCRSGPTCRSVPLRPPRLIFVGVTDRLLEFTEICKSDRPRMRMASTSGLQLPSAVRVPGARLAENACLPWALPLAGLSGTFRRASAGLDPGFDHQPPEPSTDNSFAATIPIRSWAWATSRSITRCVARRAARRGQASVIAKY
jgi:hypothetical protein